MQNEYTTNASFVNQYCSDEKSDCNVLLKSSYGKILNAVSWSELGFIYFAGNVIYLLYNNLSAGSVFALYIFAIVNCIFSFYSIWHQMYISKQWCKFCLATLSIFWSNFVLLSFLPKFFVLSDFINLTGSLALIATIWFSIKTIFEKYYYYWIASTKTNKIKYKKDVFEYLLDKQTKLNDAPISFSLIKGEEKTQNILTIVSNPDCEGCKAEFKDVEKYILGAYDNLQINMVFSSKKSDTEGFRVANTILYIQEKEGFHKAITALKDWYESMSISKWENKYGRIELEHRFLSEHKNWLITNGITVSPTVVFNNSLIPDGYKLSDLKYFI